MSSTIAQLWSGNLDPVAHVGSCNTAMRELERLMRRHLASLETALSGDAAAVFEKYNDCMQEYMCILSEQAFCDGYRLATKLMVEALSSSLT